MDKMAFRDFLLSTLPGSRSAGGGSQIICLCPLCGDIKGHCYVGPFDGDDTTPVMYNCFKCDPSTPGKSGYVNQAFMNRYNQWLPEEFSAKRKPGEICKKRIGQRTVLNLDNRFLTESEESQKKLQYINKRLGLNLTYQDTVNLKLVLNLSDLLNGNKINTYTRGLVDMQYLDKYFVGAIGVNNNMISLRNMYKDQFEAGGYNGILSMKYVNYIISNTMDYEKMYVVPCNVDIFKPINIHVCEGYFDALGIYFNVLNARNDNDIVVAGFGKSYEECVNYFLKNSPTLHVNVHFYPDADVKNSSIESVTNKLSLLVDSITIHRNGFVDPETHKVEKDFGVPKDRIIDTCRTMNFM